MAEEGTNYQTRKMKNNKKRKKKKEKRMLLRTQNPLLFLAGRCVPTVRIRSTAPTKAEVRHRCHLWPRPATLKARGGVRWLTRKPALTDAVWKVTTARVPSPPSLSALDTCEYSTDKWSSDLTWSTNEWTTNSPAPNPTIKPLVLFSWMEQWHCLLVLNVVAVVFISAS